MRYEDAIVQPIDWTSPKAVNKTLKERTHKATDGFVCIDERETIPPIAFLPQEGLFNPTEHEQIIYDSTGTGFVDQKVRHPNAIKIPGGSFGVAAAIQGATGIGGGDSVDLAHRWHEALETDFSIHPDNCGFMLLTESQPHRLGILDAQGVKLVSATIELPNNEKTIVTSRYVGEHDAEAVIINDSSSHTFNPRGPGGAAFVVDKKLASNAFARRGTGLAAFLRREGVVSGSQKELAENLSETLANFIDVTASVLAPGKPLYVASVRQTGSSSVSTVESRGLVPSLAA